MAVRDVVMAAAGQAGSEAIYVDDVFSTYLYTGNGSTQTINNGIDLAGEGGLVWIKRRSSSQSHYLSDSARGVGKVLSTDTTTQELNIGSLSVSSFNADGFGIPSGDLSTSSQTYASWTLRKAPKFFDVVTYTGNGDGNRALAHSLGSTPGCVIVKRTDSTSDWGVWHRGSGGSSDITGLNLNGTNAAFYTNAGVNAYFTSTTIGVAYIYNAAGSNVFNANGATYVAYLFAHDAGGFGATGNDNVISCGSTGGSKVTLGWEPQWILHKSSNFANDWSILDVQRGMPWGAQAQELEANRSDAEALSRDDLNAQNYSPKIYADGFELGTIVGSHIYIAIRRPHKPPTSGTEVFATDTRGSTGDGKAPTYRSPFPVDMQFNRNRTYEGGNMQISARLTQGNQMWTNLTNAESSNAAMMFDYMNGVQTDTGTNTAQSAWMFRRAPGFFDVVAYTGTGSAGRTVTHNLGVTPELMIVKVRSITSGWATWAAPVNSGNNYLLLNSTMAYAVDDGAIWGNGTTHIDPTSTVFTVSAGNSVNSSGNTYVAYLFASLPGISKVGSYTGNGTSQTINCGFAAGARFFLVKATSTTGSWWVYDSARGIVSAADPALQLNSADAEVTSADAVDPTATGIIVNQEATCSINASGVSYIFLAIA